MLENRMRGTREPEGRGRVEEFPEPGAFCWMIGGKVRQSERS